MKNKPTNMNSDLSYEIASKIDTYVYMDLLSHLEWFIYDSLNCQLCEKLYIKIRFNLGIRLYKYIKKIP